MLINIPSQDEIVDFYGATHQFGIHMEECAELIQAISKCQRVYENVESTMSAKELVKNHLIEEMADVLICMEQLKYIFKISDEEIEKEVEYKVNRQKERIHDNQ